MLGARRPMDAPRISWTERSPPPSPAAQQTRAAGGPAAAAARGVRPAGRIGGPRAGGVPAGSDHACGPVVPGAGGRPGWRSSRPADVARQQAGPGGRASGADASAPQQQQQRRGRAAGVRRAAVGRKSQRVRQCRGAGLRLAAGILWRGLRRRLPAGPRTFLLCLTPFPQLLLANNASFLLCSSF